MKRIQVVHTIAALVGLGMVLAAAGKADTIVQTFTMPDTAAPWPTPATFTFNKFDPALGTLTGVTLSVSSHMFADVDVYNSTSGPLAFTDATASQPVRLDGPNGFVDIDTLFAGPVDGTVPALSFVDVALAEATSSHTYNIASSDWSFYSGSGGVTGTLTGTTPPADYAGTGPTGLFFGGDATVGMTVVLTFTYTPVGPFVTYTQGGWGARAHGFNPGYYRDKYFATACPNGIFIGDMSKNYFLFTSSAAVQAFLPQGKGPDVLPAGSKTNPTGKGSELWGQQLSVKLAVAFSDAGVFTGGFSALKVQSGPFMGLTVAQMVAIGDAWLGGTALPAFTPAGVAIGDLNTCLDNINECFDGGTANTGFLK